MSRRRGDAVLLTSVPAPRATGSRQVVSGAGELLRPGLGLQPTGCGWWTHGAGGAVVSYLSGDRPRGVGSPASPAGG